MCSGSMPFVYHSLTVVGAMGEAFDIAAMRVRMSAPLAKGPAGAPGRWRRHRRRRVSCRDLGRPPPAAQARR
jgi:hypothetical protein